MARLGGTIAKSSDTSSQGREILPLLPFCEIISSL